MLQDKNTCWWCSNQLLMLAHHSGFVFFRLVIGSLSKNQPVHLITQPITQNKKSKRQRIERESDGGKACTREDSDKEKWLTCLSSIYVTTKKFLQITEHIQPSSNSFKYSKKKKWNCLLLSILKDLILWKPRDNQHLWQNTLHKCQSNHTHTSLIS